jgi:hypothetical protein
VRFIGPDLVSSSVNWFSTMMNDATVMAKVAHFGLHSYSDGGGGSDGFSDFIQRSPYPDRTFWMTEFNVWCDICESAQGGTNSWDYASGAARYLLYHLANGASAGLVWEGYDSQYNYYSPGQWSYWGLFAVDDINAVPKTYSPRKIFYTLAQIAKFVRPGAKRIGTSSSPGSLLLVPFFHPGSGQLTLVGINSDINETMLTGTLSNLPPVASLDLYYTDAAANLLHSQTVQVTNGIFTATIPPDCVFALVGSSSGPLPPGAFLPRKGFYNGLFYTTDRTAARSSGFCAISTTAKGRFTGRLLLGSARYSLSGPLDSGGHAHLNIPRRNLAPLTVDLQIDSTSDSDSITGTVSDGTWTANLLARRATFDGKMTIAPQAGQYTFVFQGSRGSTATPAGDSYGTVSVDKAGEARLTCWLADGARANQSVSLSGAGEFPLYLSLYGRNGFVSGWLNVTNTPQDDLNGTVSWSKPTTPKTKFYQKGFSIETSASGSRYQRPAKGEKVLNLSGAEIVLAGAGLKTGITNEIVLNTGNRISNFGNNKLNLAFNPSSGLFKGSATWPALLKPIQFNGVILQTQNVGRGFFLDRDESGAVFIGGTSSP